MNTEPFRPFTTEHLATIIAGGAIIGGLLLAGRRSWRGRNLAAALLAFANLFSYPLNQLGWLSLDGPVALDNILPLQLCDIAAFLAGFALITRHPLLCSLTYFWGLAATFQALVTPALVNGFPSLIYFGFFIQHFAVVATALFLPIVDGWRPKAPLWKSTLVAYVCAFGYLLFALAVNKVLGTNFGFVSRPPPNPSIIDHLGPWPLYLLSMMGVGLMIFSLLALPHARKGTGPGRNPEDRPS